MSSTVFLFISLLLAKTYMAMPVESGNQSVENLTINKTDTANLTLPTPTEGSKPSTVEVKEVSLNETKEEQSNKTKEVKPVASERKPLIGGEEKLTTEIAPAQKTISELAKEDTFDESLPAAAIAVFMLEQKSAPASIVPKSEETKKSEESEKVELPTSEQEKPKDSVANTTEAAKPATAETSQSLVQSQNVTDPVTTETNVTGAPRLITEEKQSNQTVGTTAVDESKTEMTKVVVTEVISNLQTTSSPTIQINTIPQDTESPKAGSATPEPTKSEQLPMPQQIKDSNAPEAKLDEPEKPPTQKDEEAKPSSDPGEKQDLKKDETKKEEGDKPTEKPDTSGKESTTEKTDKNEKIEESNTLSKVDPTQEPTPSTEGKKIESSTEVTTKSS